MARSLHTLQGQAAWEGSDQIFLVFHILRLVTPAPTSTLEAGPCERYKHMIVVEDKSL
ncbi:MAG: hypothetical protein OXC80_02105 [Gammaproteobacteria bacterium]|nr:hypothetical protein [Gammaproteobacteria bacterium]